MARLVIVFTFCQLSFIYYTKNSELYGKRNGQLLFAVKYTFYSCPGQSKPLLKGGGGGGGENATKHRKGQKEKNLPTERALPILLVPL